MNRYQKFGIFIVRIIGAVMVCIAVMGLLLYAFTAIHKTTADNAYETRWPASILWLVVGAGLLTVAERLGRWLGRALD